MRMNDECHIDDPPDWIRDEQSAFATENKDLVMVKNTFSQIDLNTSSTSSSSKESQTQPTQNPKPCSAHSSTLKQKNSVRTSNAHNEKIRKERKDAVQPPRPPRKTTEEIKIIPRRMRPCSSIVHGRVVPRPPAPPPQAFVIDHAPLTHLMQQDASVPSQIKISTLPSMLSHLREPSADPSAVVAVSRRHQEGSPQQHQRRVARHSSNISGASPPARVSDVLVPLIHPHARTLLVHHSFLFEKTIICQKMEEAYHHVHLLTLPLEEVVVERPSHR